MWTEEELPRHLLWPNTEPDGSTAMSTSLLLQREEDPSRQTQLCLPLTCPLLFLVPVYLFAGFQWSSVSLWVRGQGQRAAAAASAPSESFHTDWGQRRRTFLKRIKSFLLLSGKSCAPEMACRLNISLFLWLLLVICEAGRQMSKLSNKKLCADSECSRE